jgi:hypothetical protein
LQRFPFALRYFNVALINNYFQIGDETSISGGSPVVSTAIIMMYDFAFNTGTYVESEITCSE